MTTNDLTAGQQAYLAAHAECVSGLEAVSSGICGACPDCQRAHGMTPRAFYAACEAGRVCDEPSFSWGRCEGCGSGLGGDRHAGHALDANGDLLHLELCTDCVLFLANGDLPETWGE